MYWLRFGHCDQASISVHGHFYWQCAHFIELFFNYALFLIEFVDVQGDCGWRSRAKLPTEAGPGRGFLLAHNLRPVV